jgi:hypothetical protein
MVARPHPETRETRAPEQCAWLLEGRGATLDSRPAPTSATRTASSAIASATVSCNRLNAASATANCDTAAATDTATSRYQGTARGSALTSGRVSKVPTLPCTSRQRGLQAERR